MFKLILVLICGSIIYSTYTDGSLPDYFKSVESAAVASHHDMTLKGDVDSEMASRNLVFNWEPSRCKVHAEYINAIMSQSPTISISKIQENEVELRQAIERSKSDACVRVLNPSDSQSNSYKSWVLAQAKHFKDSPSCKKLKENMIRFSENSTDTEDQKRVSISKGMISVMEKGCYQ